MFGVLPCPSPGPPTSGNHIYHVEFPSTFHMWNVYSSYVCSLSLSTVIWRLISAVAHVNNVTLHPWEEPQLAVTCCPLPQVVGLHLLQLCFCSCVHVRDEYGLSSFLSFFFWG